VEDTTDEDIDAVSKSLIQVRICNFILFMDIC